MNKRLLILTIFVLYFIAVYVIPFVVGDPLFYVNYVGLYFVYVIHLSIPALMIYWARRDPHFMWLPSVIFGFTMMNFLVDLPYATNTMRGIFFAMYLFMIVAIFIMSIILRNDFYYARRTSIILAITAVILGLRYNPLIAYGFDGQYISNMGFYITKAFIAMIIVILELLALDGYREESEKTWT